MKRNSSVFCLFMTVFIALTACTNDDFIPRPVHPSLPGSITIAVIDEAAFSSDPENRGAVTRTVENDYATEFTDGDKIGVFAIEINSVNSRSFIYENLCFVYNGKTWDPDNQGIELSYIPQEQGSRIYFFSYYPYQHDMTGMYNLSATDSNGVKTTKADRFFSSLIDTWYPADDQSTYEAYTANDLMVATGELTPGPNGRILTFKMEHQMGLVILDLPGTECTYTETVNGVTHEKSYPLYTGVSLPDRFWRKDRYSARTIIKPRNTFSSDPCTYYDDELTQRQFQVTTVLQPGQFRHCTVDGGEVKKVSRPLKEGDYYMDDGGIVPNEKVPNVSSMPAGKCLGVVFWVGEKEGIHWTRTGAQEGDHLLMADHPGCTRGMVVGLKDTPSLYAWSSNVSSGLWDWADSFNFPTEEQKKVEMIRSSNALFGYNRSLLFPLYKDINLNADFPAYESVKTYASANPAPEGSSGWFLPGQYELAAMCFGTPSGYTNDLAMKRKLDSWFAKAGGEALQETYWSDSEDDTGDKAWCVHLSVPSYGFEVKTTQFKVRPVLAF